MIRRLCKLGIFFILSAAPLLHGAPPPSSIKKPLQEVVSSAPTSEALLPIEKNSSKSGSVDLTKAFFASPIIYSILVVLSLISTTLCLHSLLTYRRSKLLPQPVIDELKKQLVSKNFDAALYFCQHSRNLLTTIISAGIQARDQGMQWVLNAMQSEGRRATSSFWQKITILNDIVLLSPMLGLLGTVIGIFLAFYDIHRSNETLVAVFDGLGIAIGTTVGGIVVAVITMIGCMILKYRVVRVIHLVEQQAVTLSPLLTTEKTK